MKMSEIVVFVLYLLAMLGIGIFFFLKDKEGDDKTFFLGNRKMGAWVSALSAGASDMSAWVLMGLPTAIFVSGMGQVWIAIGLALGYSISWIVQAPRLRKFTIVSGDAITIPQYLSNRFLAKSRALQMICAIVFLLAYTIYAASSVKACGILFNKVIGMEPINAMYLAAVVIVGYTFLGGFSAVCWTDFFQGMLMLGAMLLLPLFAVNMLPNVEAPFASDAEAATFWSFCANWKDILSGLAWGLGYFGMPHIIVRFMSIKSHRELRKSSIIGISWTVLILFFAALIGIVGRLKLGNGGDMADVVENEMVFIHVVRMIFPGVISGLLLSAILAASMSTADSQLLAASSAFASDMYKDAIRDKKADSCELLWMGRMVVLIVALVAMLLASNSKAGNIMSLVSNAWGVFGASFGPVIMLSLFWKRFNFSGAIAGIVAGASADIAWIIISAHVDAITGIYELLPATIFGLLVAVIATLVTAKPSAEIEKLYDEAVNYGE